MLISKSLYLPLFSVFHLILFIKYINVYKKNTIIYNPLFLYITNYIEYTLYIKSLQIIIIVIILIYIFKQQSFS